MDADPVLEHRDESRRTSGGPFLTVPQVAATYGVEQGAVRKWLHRRRIQRGPGRTVDAASLEHYLAIRGEAGQHARTDES